MKRAVRILGILVAAFTLGACAGGVEPDEDVGQSGLPLEERQACGVENPGCPSGQTCATVDLGSGPETRCQNLRSVCQRLCGDRQCLILESFPVQVRCL
ncbi:hypothetical protein [Archangium sp.]|uniref:hypothetical protein n=1 Tax=Archangium sp. TaxID=1872627 RepID=UPI002D4ABD25|nr:hypothetical protein [Archangium sp.]HYO55028.1 hypothetical protein [Archangium sp.]